MLLKNTFWFKLNEMKNLNPAPQKTRDLEKSRSEILQAAFVTIFKGGFQATSIDDIVKKTSLTKGAFYHHFPTKLDLGYALVEEVIQPMIIERWIRPLEAFDDPCHGILSLLKKLIGQASPSELKLGCPLNNLVQEMAPLDSGFKKRLRNALELWISELELHLVRAKKIGLLKRDVDPRQVAQFVVMAHEGFYGMLKGLDDRRAFPTLFQSLERYFDAIQG